MPHDVGGSLPPAQPRALPESLGRGFASEAAGTVRHRERRATKATLHRERKGLRCSIFSLITERGEPPRQLFIGRGGYSATQSALITERGEPPRRLFIGRGGILHHATRSHHRERRATKAALHRERRGLRHSIVSLLRRLQSPTFLNVDDLVRRLVAACCCLLLLAAACCCCLPLLAAAACFC